MNGRTPTRCVVFGVGTRYVYEVDEMIGRLGWEVAGYVVNRPDSPRPDGLSPLVDADSLPESLIDLPVVVPVGTPGHRSVAVSEAKELGFTEFPAVVDPTSAVGSSADISIGVLVAMGTMVAARVSIGAFTVINRGVSVGHDSKLDVFAFLGPGAIVCGGVVIGRGAFLGAGAIVNPDIVVGENAVIGSGSVVVGDVAPNTLVVGSPARVVKDSIPGAGGISV